MIRALQVRPAAAEEIREAAAWYEDRAPGLGRAFLAVLDQIEREMLENPARFPLLYRDVRRALMGRFPYGVFFRQREERLIVLAVVHLARDPNRWQSR